ncbi:MAG: DNA polymerase III subunit delta' [Dehalococcoidia bacterium]|nr:DNA polymerase III subunit delta' [Dehalococcoidia bacterium]
MWTIIGQEQAIAALSRARSDGRLSHAYLFSGPPQVGKRTAAVQFAQALNCRGEDPPCRRCRQCYLIEQGSHPDVELITVGGLCDESSHDHSSDNSRDIRICQVRRLERVVSRTPFEGRYRVLIIDPADALNVEASNAFLKTLEEPPPSLVLILITSREESLLPTVVSRCRKVPFSLMTVTAVQEALEEEWSVPPEDAGLLARLSGGRLGWAVTAWEDETVLPARTALLEDAYRLTTVGRDERFAYAAELGGRFSRDREGVLRVLELWRDWWRDVLLVASGCPDIVTNVDALDRLGLLARKYTVEEIRYVLQAIAGTRRSLLDNINAQLALEVLMLDLAAPSIRKEKTSATGPVA